MPQADKQDVPLHKPETLEGRVLEPANAQEMEDAVRLAFDYRGDVTLHFQNGTTVTGFLSNYDKRRGALEVFVPEGKTSEAREVPVEGLQKIAFTGPDAAFGKSWDDWMKKSQAVRELEAQRLREESEKLGHL